MGKRSYVILCACLLATCRLSAQSAQQADEQFAQKEYAHAKETYGHLLRKAPQNALYLYRYARCAYELGEEEEAIRYFEEAGEKYALRNFYLGELYLATYRFDKAIAAYEKYADSIGENHERYAYVEGRIAQAQKGARYLKRVDDIVITDSVVLRKEDFLKAYRLSKESGSLSLAAGNVCYTNERQDRQIISTDENGRKDLLSCQRLLEGEFVCDTLPAPVNNPSDEAYPFVLSDGITLYFASNSPEGLGGYDIYVTRYNSDNESYLTPENLGMPFNSPRNDYMLAIDEIRNIGYFATDRRTADSLVAVYTFVPNEDKRILRNQSDEYIRLAAQLKAYRTDTAEGATPVVSTTTQEPLAKSTESEFAFILNDSTVYRHLSDFRSADARVLYEQYQALKQQLDECRRQLAQHRKHYAETTEDERKELMETLLQLEQNYIRLRRQEPQLLNKIRDLERKVQ